MTDIDEIAARHVQQYWPNGNPTGYCRGEMMTRWPCDTARVLEALRAEREGKAQLWIAINGALGALVVVRDIVHDYARDEATQRVIETLYSALQADEQEAQP